MDWDNTNKYLDDIERRLQEVMDRPVQPDYQEGPGAGAAYLDMLKEGIGKLLEWRASKTTPYNMESYMNPTDEDIMRMIPMMGAARKVNPWAKGAGQTGQRAGTKWGVEGQHYKSPYEGLTNDKWVEGKSAANDAIEAIMSKFTPGGSRIPPTRRGPTEMPWEEVAQAAGIDPNFGAAMGSARSGASTARPMRMSRTGQTTERPWSDVAEETGFSPEEVSRVAGRGGDMVWPDAPTSMWNQPAFNVLAELVNSLTPQPIARGIKAFQDLPEGLKGVIALMGGGAVAGHAVSGNAPEGRYSGGAESARVRPNLREYVNPEQQRMIDEGIPFSPEQSRGGSVTWRNIIRDLIYDNLIAGRPAR